MDESSDEIAGRAVRHGVDEACRGITGELARSLATLEFADKLRRAAERLSHESALEARTHGASWRAVGEAVGGITPQGAEHRFSPSAKERRSKASKADWAQKERRIS
jgi:hypothetical protein